MNSELSKYLLGKQTLIILPRFMRNEEVIPSLISYLEKSGYKDEDISLYSEIPLEITRIKYTEIFLYEWVCHPKLLVGLLKINPQILHMSYIQDNHSIKFAIRAITMTGDMADLYNTIRKDKQAMYENHYYGLLSPEDCISSLKDCSIYTYYFGEGIESMIDKPLPSIHDVHMPHPKASISHNRDLELDSPKISEIIRMFAESPGKFVIMTKYRGIYGATLIQTILGRLFQAKISLLNERTSCDIKDKIISEFNKSKKGFLITCIVPHEQLIGVTDVIIFDDYSIYKILGLLRASFGNEFRLTLLVAIHEYLTTDSLTKAQETHSYLHKQEDTYSKLLNKSKNIMIKDKDLYVT